MASAEGERSQRVGPWARVAVALELALVAYAWSWTSQLAAGLVGLDASSGVHGGTYLLWALLATSAGFALLLLALSVRGARAATLGLFRPRRGWPRALLVGLAWGAGLYLVSLSLTSLGTRLGLEHELDVFSIESAASWLGWMAGGLLAGAFGEELFYRGWLIERVERVLAGWVPEAWTTRAGVLAGALWFGAQHAYQGSLAVVTVTVLGLGLGLAFLRSGRNLVVPVVAHGVLDIIGLSEIYLAA